MGLSKEVEQFIVDKLDVILYPKGKARPGVFEVAALLRKLRSTTGCCNNNNILRS